MTRPYVIAIACLPADDYAILTDWIARCEPSAQFRELSPGIGVTNEMVGLGGLLSHSAELLRNALPPTTEGEPS